jgi:flagellar hook-associated protein 2
MADYSLLGSFNTGGASALNGELLAKLKNAEKGSVLFNIDHQLEDITGLDANTGKVLDTLGESDVLSVIKAQTLDLMSKMSIFDLDSTGTTAFDAVSASTTGTAAVFDAVDIGGLEPGTNNIDINSLAQRDVFQSPSFNSSFKDGGIPIGTNDINGDLVSDNLDLPGILASKISVSMIDTSLTGKVISKSVNGSDTVSGSITIGGITFTNDGSTTGQTTYQDLANQINAEATLSAEIGTDGRIVISNDPDSTTNISITGDTFDLGVSSFNYVNYDFNAVTDTSVTDIADVGYKGVSDLVDEINANEKLIASIETVGTDEYRIVIKSAVSGINNSLKISQTNVNLGFNEELKSTAITTPTDTKAGEITVNGTTFTNDGVTPGQVSYTDLVAQIDAHADFNASLDANNKLVVTSTDGYTSIDITNDSFDLGFSSTSQTQKAQNLNATVDGIEYNVDSNTLTIQGNLTMTAVEIGKSTIDIQKDTSAILNGVGTMISSYNALVDLVTTETGKADGVMTDNSSLRSLLSSIKDSLFGSYGENNDLNLFSFGLELDLSGHLSLDNSKFGEALVDNYSDIKNLFLGNTVNEELASTDSTKYLGMGTAIHDYLDELDSSDGMMTRYEENIASRKLKLEEERTKAIATLDSKYASMASQFSLYGSAITQMESSFAGLESMIKQSYVSK